jgi:hypothetical protein
VAHLTSTDLEHAKLNLRRCTSFGLTERLKESLEILCSTLLWKPFAEVPHVNQGSGDVPVAELDPHTLSALIELTRLDAELYRLAVADFEQSCRTLSAAGRASQP